VKRIILSIVLLCIFTATYVYPGTLKFGAGSKIKSHLLVVSSRAVPMVIDYDLNGTKDLIIGDENGYVWFYQNWGSDTAPKFTVRGVELKVGGVPIDVTYNAAPIVVDWNNDQVLDLLIGGSDGKISLFTGSYFSPPTPPILPDLASAGTILTIPANNAVPCVYDWNDDNKKDLIIGDGNGDIWVYLNSGSDNSPLFTDSYKVSLPISVGNDAVPRVVHWDSKGNKDLIVGNAEGEIYVFLSGTETTKGTPTFTTGKKIQAGNNDIDVGANAAPFIIDWDNDGNIDLVVGELDGSLNLFRNTNKKPPKFSLPSKIPGEAKDLDAGRRIIPFIIDFNDDGKKDLIVGDRYGYIKFYQNEGTNDEPIFTAPYIFQQNPGTPTDIDVGYNASPFVYDWDYDGNKDLIVGDEEGYIYLFYGEDDSPVFKLGVKITTGTGTNDPIEVPYDATPIMCDWDNDGDMDIVVGERYGYVNLFINSGNNKNPIFTQSQKITADGAEITVGKNAKPFVEDFNDDGKKDLIIGNKDGYVKVYLNIGEDDTPVFTTQQQYHFQVQANSYPLQLSGFAAPVLVDWNEDNIYDLIVGEEDGYINLYTGIIENSKPNVIPITPVGTQTNNVTINYILKDDEGDACSIVVKYSTNDGITFNTATAGYGGDGVENLSATPDGVRHSFVWDSEKDLIGGFVGKIIIKIIPHDGKVEGVYGETKNFWVNNLYPPNWERIKLNGADLNLDYYSTPIVIDWDEDGWQDILIGSEAGYVYFCKNVGTNEFPEFKVAYELQVEGGELLKVNNHSSPFVYNWNSTGGNDLLVGDSDGYVTFFENTGNYLKLAQGKRIKVGTDGVDLKVPGNATPVVVDWNRDGYKDLVVGDKNGNVYLYLNRNISPQPDISPLLSTGVKIQANSDLDVGNDATPYITDWDNDGRDDLIIGNREGYVFHYKNIGSNGTPSFSSGVKIKFEEKEIKVDANSRPFILKQDGDEIDLIVGSKGGYIFLYHLTGIGMNTSPQLTITEPRGTQSIQVGSVTITYTLVDAQWDTCKINVEFSTDQENWYLATGTPKTDLKSSPEGVEHTFIWFSKEDLPQADNLPLWLKFTPNDEKIDGSATIVSFILDNLNKPPIVTNVTANPIGKYGQVEISYDLQDADNDLCKIFVMYQGGSKGNTWATATVVGTVTNILPGTGLKLTWLSAVDEKNQSAKDYKIKITPFDIEYGTYGISTAFEVNNLSISAAIVPKGTTTTLSFSPTTIEILEPFSNDFDVLITVEKNPKGIPKMNTLAALDNTVRRITAVMLPDTEQLAPPRRAKITIPYDDLHSFDTENSLRIFELREGRWVLIGGTPHVENNYVTAEVAHFSVFRIGLYATTFKVYPNPFKDNDDNLSNGELGVSGRDYIVFEGVTKVEIYTIAGELVRESKVSEIDDSDCWRWNLRNDYGRLVGSGIYIYVVKTISDKTIVGRLGVIR